MLSGTSGTKLSCDMVSPSRYSNARHCDQHLAKWPRCVSRHRKPLSQRAKDICLNSSKIRNTNFAKSRDMLDHHWTHLLQCRIILRYVSHGPTHIFSCSFMHMARVFPATRRPKFLAIWLRKHNISSRNGNRRHTHQSAKVILR